MPQTLHLPFKRLGHYLIYQSIALPLFALLVMITLLITPVGEFPLNDDWIYAKTVQHLLQTGQYQAHPYLNATLVVQTYWGALFCKLFGFSFSTLRMSTLVLSGLNAWGIARCGLVMGFPRVLALLCGAVVITNPLMLGLSYSFMTDIPFLALSTLSGLCFLSALRRDSTPLIAWGSVLGVAAFFVRQFGVLVPAAFAITLAILQIRRQVSRGGAPWLALGIPWVLAGVIYLGYAQNLQSQTPILESTDNRLWMVLLDTIRYLPLSFTYLGLFIFPLGVMQLWQLWQGHIRWNKGQWRLWIGFYGISLFTFVLPQLLFGLNQVVAHKTSTWLQDYPDRMPFFPAGILLNLGIGNDASSHLNPYPTVECALGWWIATFLAVGIGGLVFVKAWEQFKVWRYGSDTQPEESLEQNPQTLFLWLWVLLVLLALYNPWRVVITDRYILAAFGPLTLTMASEIQRFSYRGALKWAVLWASIVLMVGLVLVQDYMAWNRTAAFAQARLMTVNRVPAGAIAGVDQLNGWYNSEAHMQRYNTRSWWDLNIGHKGPWVLDDEYVITSEKNRMGYDVLERIPYFSWAGWQEKTLTILKRFGSSLKQ
jgi:Dolichyl-phosphate-mannose-protein mannosyltransferase